MAGLQEIPRGPFLNVKKRGLVWIGTPEQCDRCKELWPMSWITFDGKRYLCTACDWDVHVDKKSEEIAVAEDLNLIEVCSSCYKYFNITKLTISYNQLICRKCAKKAEEIRQAEYEKTLTPEQREEQLREQMSAYYDRMCS